MVTNAGAAREPAAPSPARQMLSWMLLGVLPLALVCAFTIGVIGDHFAFDFHTFWTAGGRVLDGQSPYPRPAVVAHAHPAAGDYEYFVYPPPFALAIVPLSALPFGVAAVLYTVGLLAALAGALAILDVRDWRCYGAAFAAVPVLSALRLGAATPVLVLLAAVAWRYRDRWPAVGAAVGGAVTIKLFVWPLLLWLLLTRRWKAATAAIGGGLAVTAVSWGALGFKALGSYPDLLRSLSRAEASESYSLVAVAYRLHLPDPQLSWLALAVPLSLVLIASCLRSPSTRELDHASFVTTIGLALLLTPILWLNYFALLIVAVAVREKTFSVYWILPLAFWASPFAEPGEHPLWQLALVLAPALVGIERARRPLPTARTSVPPGLSLGPQSA